MFCIKCGHHTIQVINSRQSRKRASVWRRRRCKDCGFTFTTYEEISPEQLKVLSRNKKVEAFSDARLLLSVARCLEHESTRKPEHAKWLTQHITDELIKRNSDLFKTDEIIIVAYETLKRFDQLASVQYGARYNDTLKRYLGRFA